MSAPALVTTTTAMNALHRNRAQVQRLIKANLLKAPHHHGRTRLLDPESLQALAGRRALPDTGNMSGTDTAYAVALHLGPRRPEEHPRRFDREFNGWDADTGNADNQWTGWWNTGEAIAAEVCAARLPLLPAVSGFVVDVRVATGYDVHPLYPGLVRFTTATPDDELRARHAEASFLPAAGSPWQRLWAPAEAATPALPAGAITDSDSEGALHNG